VVNKDECINVQNVHRWPTLSCSRLQESFTALSMAFSGKADQIN